MRRINFILECHNRISRNKAALFILTSSTILIVLKVSRPLILSSFPL